MRTASNNHFLMFKRGRGRPKKSKQLVFFQQPSVSQGSRNEHQWLKNSQQPSAEIISGAEVNSCIY
jgi:hypothetical protein